MNSTTHFTYNVLTFKVICANIDIERLIMIIQIFMAVLGAGLILSSILWTAGELKEDLQLQ